MIEVQVHLLPSPTGAHSRRRQSCAKVILHRPVRLPDGILVFEERCPLAIQKNDWQEPRVIQSIFLTSGYCWETQHHLRRTDNPLSNPSQLHNVFVLWFIVLPVKEVLCWSYQSLFIQFLALCVLIDIL